MSLRLAVARQSGLDETMAAKVDHYHSSDLPDEYQAALALADALMTQPGHIDVGLRERLHRHFDDEQILELTLDVMKWNYQKVPVALAIDEEVTPGQLTDLVFDAEGHWTTQT